jgi:hypothetical protein
MKDTFLSPNELYTKTYLVDFTHVQCFHMWGCPVYVLDPRLQDSKKIPKWKTNAHCSFYLGQSPSHSLSVRLVSSLATGHVSPQWHCVFDDLFSTVVSPRGLTDTFNMDQFHQLVSSSLECFDYEDYHENNNCLPPLSLVSEWNPDNDDKLSVVSCVIPAP